MTSRRLEEQSHPAGSKDPSELIERGCEIVDVVEDVGPDDEVEGFRSERKVVEVPLHECCPGGNSTSRPGKGLVSYVQSDELAWGVDQELKPSTAAGADLENRATLHQPCLVEKVSREDKAIG